MRRRGDPVASHALTGSYPSDDVAATGRRSQESGSGKLANHGGPTIPVKNSPTVQVSDRSRETLVLYRERPGGQTCVAGENPLAGALSIQPFEVSLFGPRLLWSLNPTELNA